MVRLIVDSEYLDMYGDESITLTKRSKDAKELDKLFADYSNTFTLPASQVNNKIFKHYYKFNVIGGYDARIKTPARLELNDMTLQDGLLRLDACKVKDGKIDQYNVTFYGYAVNLSDLFGEYTLGDLNLDAYNHVKNATTVVQGLDSGLSLFNDDVIYPLITKNNQWSAADLKNTGGGTQVLPEEFSPAIKVNAVIDTIENDFGITLNADLFSEAHFEKLYLWCPRELSDDEAAIIDNRGNPLPFQTANGQYVDSISSYSLGTLNMAAFYQEKYTSATNQIVVTPTTGSTYTIKMYGIKDGGDWLLDNSYTSSGTDTFNFIWYESDDYVQVRWYIESASSFQIDFTFDIDYYKGAAATQALTNTAVDVSVDTFATQMRLKIPDMRVIDFFGGIIKMFNLMITPTSATEFTLEPYDTWSTSGTTRDLTDDVVFGDVDVITPKLPKEVAYRYNDPKGILNARFKETLGTSYGDLSAKTQGGDTSKVIQLEFENMLWETVTDVLSNFSVGSSFEKPLDGFQDRAFLMYWGANQAGYTIALGSGAATIASYKRCTSYYPTTSPTHSLNFGSEINTSNFDQETVSLFSGYHQGYIDKIFHEALRIHKVKMQLPTHVMTNIDIKDVIKLHDVYYNINSMTLNLTDETANFELINFVRELSVVVPPVDNEAPIIGDLWIVQNPDIEVPIMGTLSASNITGDTITLNWTTATDNVAVAQYDIYQDTVLVKSILHPTLSTVITGLSNFTEYDFYIKAVDTSGNESLASNTVTETTLDVNSPVITSPSVVWWYVPTGGQSHSYQITATNSPNLYGATNVPSFLSLSTGSGLISGTVAYGDVGNYTMQVRASNNAGTSWGQYQDVDIRIIPI